MKLFKHHEWVDFLFEADESILRLGQCFCNKYNITDDILFNEKSRGKCMQIIFTKYIQLDVKSLNEIEKAKKVEEKKLKAAAKKKLVKKKIVKKKVTKKKVIKKKKD